MAKKPPAKKAVSPVLIEWYDAEVDGGWADDAALQSYLDEFEPVKSVGFLLRKPSKKFDKYVLCADLDMQNNATNRRLLIPSKWVVSVVELTVKSITSDRSKL